MEEGDECAETVGNVYFVRPGGENMINHDE